MSDCRNYRSDKRGFDDDPVPRTSEPYSSGKHRDRDRNRDRGRGRERDREGGRERDRERTGEVSRHINYSASVSSSSSMMLREGASFAVAVSNLKGVDDTEMSLVKGHRLMVMKKDTSGWWLGENMDTKQSGWFPSSFVKSVESLSEAAIVEVEGKSSSKPKRVKEPTSRQGALPASSASLVSSPFYSARQDRSGGQELPSHKMNSSYAMSANPPSPINRFAALNESLNGGESYADKIEKLQQQLLLQQQQQQQQLQQRESQASSMRNTPGVLNRFSTLHAVGGSHSPTPSSYSMASPMHVAPIPVSAAAASSAAASSAASAAAAYTISLVDEHRLGSSPTRQQSNQQHQQRQQQQFQGVSVNNPLPSSFSSPLSSPIHTHERENKFQLLHLAVSNMENVVQNIYDKSATKPRYNLLTGGQTSFSSPSSHSWGANGSSSAASPLASLASTNGAQVMPILNMAPQQEGYSYSQNYTFPEPHVSPVLSHALQNMLFQTQNTNNNAVSPASSHGQQLNSNDTYGNYDGSMQQTEDLTLSPQNFGLASRLRQELASGVISYASPASASSSSAFPSSSFPSSPSNQNLARSNSNRSQSREIANGKEEVEQDRRREEREATREERRKEEWREERAVFPGDGIGGGGSRGSSPLRQTLANSTRLSPLTMLNNHNSQNLSSSASSLSATANRPLTPRSAEKEAQQNYYAFPTGMRGLPSPSQNRGVVQRRLAMEKSVLSAPPANILFDPSTGQMVPLTSYLNRFFGNRPLSVDEFVQVNHAKLGLFSGVAPSSINNTNTTNNSNSYQQRNDNLNKTMDQPVVVAKKYAGDKALLDVEMPRDDDPKKNSERRDDTKDERRERRSQQDSKSGKRNREKKDKEKKRKSSYTGRISPPPLPPSSVSHHGTSTARPLVTSEEIEEFKDIAFIFNVKIGGVNVTEPVLFGANPDTVAVEFARKHDLPESKAQKLAKHLQQLMANAELVNRLDEGGDDEKKAEKESRRSSESSTASGPVVIKERPLSQQIKNPTEAMASPLDETQANRADDKTTMKEDSTNEEKKEGTKNEEKKDEKKEGKKTEERRRSDDERKDDVVRMQEFEAQLKLEQQRESELEEADSIEALKIAKALEIETSREQVRKQQEENEKLARELSALQLLHAKEKENEIVQAKARQLEKRKAEKHQEQEQELLTEHTTPARHHKQSGIPRHHHTLHPHPTPPALPPPSTKRHSIARPPSSPPPSTLLATSAPHPPAIPPPSVPPPFYTPLQGPKPPFTPIPPTPIMTTASPHPPPPPRTTTTTTRSLPDALSSTADEDQLL